MTTLDQWPSWFLLSVAPFITVVVLVAFGVATWWRYCQDQRDYYAEWVKDVLKRKPDFQPPYIVGPDGRYVENSRWRAGQLDT